MQKTTTLGKVSLLKDYAHRQQFAETLPQRNHESGYTCTSITAVVTLEVSLELQYCCRGSLGTTPVTFSGTFLSKCVATVCQTALTHRRFKFLIQNRSKLPYIRQLSTFAKPNEHMQRLRMGERESSTTPFFFRTTAQFCKLVKLLGDVGTQYNAHPPTTCHKTSRQLSHKSCFAF